MNVLNAKLEALASKYARKVSPKAKPEQIQYFVHGLCEQVDSSDLDVDEVCRRLRAKLGETSPNLSRNFGDMARACRDLDGGRLTPSERAFIKQMLALGFNRQPSQRQDDWLRAIFARLQQKAAA